MALPVLAVPGCHESPTGKSGTTLAPQSGMLSLLISTVVFVVASIFLHRYLDSWGLDKGRARTLLVLTLASLISYGSMALVDHFAGAPSVMDQVIKLEQPLLSP
jgi:hypothetical protein